MVYGGTIHALSRSSRLAVSPRLATLVLAGRLPKNLLGADRVRYLSNRPVPGPEWRSTGKRRASRGCPPGTKRERRPPVGERWGFVGVRGRRPIRPEDCPTNRPPPLPITSSRLAPRTSPAARPPRRPS